ncbi:MAG: class II fructose-bisphosphate aldolase [Candidatus Omnitrophota bacterium]
MKTGKLKQIMETACAQGIVIPAFNIAYLPMAKAVCDGLAETDAFGMLEVARPDVEKFGAESFAAVAAEYRQWADPDIVSLHLDHIPVIDEDRLPVDWKRLIKEGISNRYHSVMIDGSRLSLEENIEVTAEVVRMAHPAGILVEAELGAVLGHETGPMPPYEEMFEKKLGFTKPEEADRFVKETGVDLLSVSCGSIHGAISGIARDQAKIRAKIDIQHLKKLREAAGIPLVLHGGSGIQKSCVLEAVKNGITKINIGTEIRQAYEQAMAKSNNTVKTGQAAVTEKVKELVTDSYGIKGSASRLVK